MSFNRFEWAAFTLCLPLVAAADNIKPSQIFCGNVRLYQNDPLYPAWAGWPNPDPAIFDDNGRAICRGGSGGPWAIQNFEVRGWVTGDANMCTDPTTGGIIHQSSEEEFFLDIALDLDWTASPPEPGEPPIVPLNTLQALQLYLPATDVIEFGNRHITPPNDNTAWGGPGRAIIHVEVDAWGPTRGGSTYSERPPPPNWDQCAEEYRNILGIDIDIGPTFFNHNVIAGDGSFHAGDYVSVIGTLFYDGSHILCHWWPFGCDSDARNQAKICWRNHTGGDQLGQRYWAEMHSPDKITKLTAPPGKHPSDIIAYVSCSDDPRSFSDFPTLTPPNSLPNTRISSVEPLIWGQNYTASPPNVVGGNQVLFGFQSTGAMLAYYKVNWTCTPACRCDGTDGCGGTCTPFACPGDQICYTGGYCVCPLPGQTLCSCTGSCMSQQDCSTACTGCPGGTVLCDCNGSCMTPQGCAAACSRCPPGFVECCGGCRRSCPYEC